MKTLSNKTDRTEMKEYVAKLEKRQADWQWNRPLLLTTVVFVALIAAGSFASYRYHTTQTSQIYVARARGAGESGDIAEQAKWLQRYLMIRPHDMEAVVTVAIAADEAVDSATPAQRPEVIERARRLLSSSIARLGSQDLEQLNELRVRLIKRLLQLGGAWYREAQRQVVSLGADATDPQANRWMAEALVGQVRLARYDPGAANKYDPQDDYWNWLSHQKPGEVLIKAIELNPAEADLIGSLVELFQASPEMFDQVSGNAKQREAALAQRIESTFGGIIANTDSQSHWIRYRFEKHRDQIEKANQILLPAAEEAATRLASAADLVDRPSEDQANDQRWNYVLLSEAARQVSDSDPPLAMAYYEQLTAYCPQSVPAQVAENAFLLAGQLGLRQGDADAATKFWKRGLVFNPISLELLGSLTSLQVYQLQNNPQLSVLDPMEGLPPGEQTADQNGSVDQATATLRRFTEAIETLSTRLFQASEASLPRDTKLILGRRLETARWRAQVLQATLATLNDRPREAIVELREAVTSTAEVDDSERIAVTLQLASLYQSEGAWDQVAMMLEEATKRSPANATLRARAADAWARAGNQNQSQQQWRMAGNSNLIGIQIASIEALLSDQLRLTPSQQDFSGMRVAIRNTRKQHAREIENFVAASETTASGQAPKPNQETSEPDASRLDQATSQAIARLEIVTVLLPPTGMNADQYWQSSDFATSLAALAQQHPGDLLIQTFAAERFAQLDRANESKLAFDRLQALTGADSMAVAVVQARIKAGQGDALGAAKGLLSYAELRTDPSNDQESDEIFQIAASYALRDRQTELAYQSLLKIPAQRRSLSTDFLIARLAHELPSESSIFQQGALASSPEQLSMEWEKQLQQREGESGSYWRLLRITRLKDQLRSQGNTIKRDDPKLREAKQILKELLTVRPRWGEAISLEGWLLAIEGQPERAVESFRRGIAAGDRRVETRTQLWQQLVMLGRETEVDDDIRAAAAGSGHPLEQYATTRIQLAVRQGDYLRSVEVARQAAEQSPGNAVAQIVFARTAALAATQPELAETRAELLQQAHQAIDVAAAIGDADGISLVSARMAITIASGDEAAIQAEIDKLQESKLPEFERLMLNSQALVAIKDYQAALPLLKQADETRPSSRTQLALAMVYRELKRGEDEVAALRRAQQRDPDNAVLRNQLAQTLVARDRGEINWQEIEQLLEASKGVTEVNQFLYAVLLGTRGQTQQQDQAAAMLREIIQERNARSEDAARVLAAIRRRQLETLFADQTAVAGDDDINAAPENVATKNVSRETRSPEAIRLGDEVRELYDSLTSKSPPEAIDLYRYADFLLQLGDIEDISKVHDILERLKNSQQGALASLEIGVRHAQKQGKQDTAPEIIDQWAQRVAQSGAIADSSVASIAGASLVKLGFVDEGLRWFQQAYEQNPDVLSTYAITLAQSGRADEARELSASHYDKHQDVNSAILLSELMLSQPEAQRNPKYQQRVDQAVKKFNRHAALLEGVATLRMQQNNYDAAIDLYQRVHALEPLWVRTLNNLAMAFSEVPGREAEGIAPIQQAIQLAGEIPELLDTKGVVLLKAGKLAEAEQVFRLAIDQQPQEPRYQFHLTLALMRQGKQAEAKHQWMQLQLDKLDSTGLTVAERQVLKQMKQTYGT